MFKITTYSAVLQDSIFHIGARCQTVGQVGELKQGEKGESVKLGMELPGKI